MKKNSLWTARDKGELWEGLPLVGRFEFIILEEAQVGSFGSGWKVRRKYYLRNGCSIIVRFTMVTVDVIKGQHRRHWSQRMALNNWQCNYFIVIMIIIIINHLTLSIGARINVDVLDSSFIQEAHSSCRQLRYYNQHNYDIIISIITIL